MVAAVTAIHDEGYHRERAQCGYTRQNGQVRKRSPVTGRRADRVRRRRQVAHQLSDVAQRARGQGLAHAAT